jgi:branched-chain amino acid transport system permease protein
MAGVVICLSFVVITGYVGQLSLVQVALAGAAGFTVSHFAQDFGIDFPLGAVLGVVVATILGFITGVSALRVRGVSLAVVTLAAAVAIEQFGFTSNTFGAGSTGSPVPEPLLFGFDLGARNSFRGLDGNLPSPVLGFCILILVVLMGLFVARLRQSGLGQRMLAVRSNERAAAAAGVSVRNTKFAAFTISSFIAGVGGVLYAYTLGSVSAERFGILIALGFVAFAYVGGITMVSGAVFGGLIATEGVMSHLMQDVLGISGTWTLLIGGVVLLLNLVFFPDGVAGSLYQKKKQKRLAKERASAAPPSPPSPVAATVAGGDR